MLNRNHEMMSGAKAVAVRFSMVAFARQARVVAIKFPVAILAWPAGEQRER